MGAMTGQAVPTLIRQLSGIIADDKISVQKKSN